MACKFVLKNLAINVLSLSPFLFGFLFPFSLSVSLFLGLFLLEFLFSPLLAFVELAGIMVDFPVTAFRPCDRSPVCHLMFDISLQPLPGTDEVSGCYARWSIPYRLLLKLPECAYACHCNSNCSFVLFFSLVFLFFRVQSPHFVLADLVAVMLSDL